MEITPNRSAPRALLRLGQTELAKRRRVSVVTIRGLEDGHSRRVAPSTLVGIRNIPRGPSPSYRIPDADALYEDLRAISLRSAARLQGRELLMDTDFYDESGLPA
jgi:hypothetical protein